VSVEVPEDLVGEVERLIEKRAKWVKVFGLRFCPECAPNAKVLEDKLREITEAAARSLEIAERALEIASR